MAFQELHQVLASHLVGGAAVIAIRLSSSAKRRGIRVRSWVTGEGPAAEALDSEGIPRRVYDLDGLFGGPWARFQTSRQVWTGLASLRRPLVHVHGPLIFNLLRPALFAAGARVVVHFHIEPTPEEISWTLKVPPHHIVACANYIATQVREAVGARAAKTPVTVVPNSVDVDRFVPGDSASARRRLALDTDRFVVLMLANLAPHKGQVTTLRAVQSLLRRGVPVECWLVGEDRVQGKPFEQELRELASTLGVAGAVRFLGFRQDAPVLLQAADAVVLPSAHEGLPLSILEAQSAGVPVIGSPIPGIREVVDDGRTGFLVAADDVEGYADRLHELFRFPEVYDRLSAAARQEVCSLHTWPVFEERMFSVYHSTST